MWFSAGIKGAVLAPFAWALLLNGADWLGIYNESYASFMGVMFGSFAGALFYALDVSRKQERSR